jgi:hypothetical protein
MTDRDKVKYFFRTIFFLGSIVIMFPSAYTFILMLTLQHSGEKVVGIVTKKAIVERKLQDSSGDTYNTFELDYTFQAKGKKISRKGKVVSKSNWEKLSEGDELKIIYNRNTPEKSMPEFEISAGSYIKCVIGFILGLAVLIYSFYFEPKR